MRFPLERKCPNIALECKVFPIKCIIDWHMFPSCFFDYTIVSEQRPLRFKKILKMTFEIIKIVLKLI